MRTLTVRLPEALVAEIDAESREPGISKSDVVRERLGARPSRRHWSAPPDRIADLIGAARGVPADVSARKKHYLKVTGYGQRPR